MRIAALILPMVLSGTADEPKPGVKAPAVAPKPADGDAPLPEGWPGSTAPGSIEVKAYPSYRSAVARATGASAGSNGVLFFSLFNHISRKEIAMTAPVVMTYEATMLDDPKGVGSMSMEFLYRRPTQGAPGRGVGAVVVEDHPASRYVCVGLQGAMSMERTRASVAELRAWLDRHKDEWVADGEPRELGYHGPMTPEPARLWEVQIPVKPAPKRPGRPGSSA